MKVYQSVVLDNQLTTRNNSTAFYKVAILILLSFFIILTQLSAQRTYTWTGGTSTAWDNTNNWTKSPTGGTFPGDGATNDIVVISTATNQPTITATPNNPIASLSIGSGANITLTISGVGVSLTVSGAVTINSITGNTNRTYTIAGTGTLNCATFNFGTNVAPSTPNNTNPTFQVNSTIAALNITGNLTLYANFATTNRFRNPVFNHTAGTVTVGGALRTTHENTANTCTYTLGGTSPRLILSGTTPYSMNTNGTAGTNTFTFTGTDATVEYSSSSNVSIPSSPAGALSYTNLEISGGGGNVKTPAGNLTVNGILTVAPASTLAMGTNTLGTPTSIIMETIGGGNGAAITGSTGNITLGGGITVNYTGTGAITSGASINKVITLGTADRTFTVNDDGDGTTTDFTISSVISSGTGGGIIKEGAGTLTLSGANSYTGGFDMNAGKLNINNASALGDVTGTFTIAGGVIQNTSAGAITTNNHPISLTGNFEHAGTQNLNLGTGAVAMSADININTSVSGRILTIGGAIDEAGFSLTKSGLGTLNFGSQTISLNALTISGGTLLATSGTMNIHGVFTNNATFSNNVGTVVMNGVGSSIAGTAITFNDLIIAATPTAQSQYNTSFTVADVLTINGGVTFAPTGGTITMSTASSSIVNSGTTTFSGLTIATTPTAQSQYNTSFGVSGALTINGGVTFAPTGGTITMSAVGSSIANTGTKTFNNLTIAATPTAQSQYNTSFSVAGALTINGSVTFAPTGGTITMSAVGSSISNSGTTTFQNLIIAATPTAQSQYNTSFSVAAAFTVNGGVTFAPTGGTITMSAVGSSIANTGTKTFNNLTIAATPTAQSQYNTSFSVAGALTINGSVTFAPTGGTITMSDVGSSISNSGTTTFQNLIIAATPTAQSQYNTSFSVAAAFTVNGGVTFAPTGGTITMSAVGSSIANTGTKTFNNLTIAATPTAQSQYNTSFSVAGALTINGSVTFAPTGGTITMSAVGSSISNSGTTTFQNLTIAATPTAQSQYNTSFNVAAAFTVNGSVTFAPTGGTITMNNAASSISNSGTLTFNNLTVSATPSAQSQYNTSFTVAGTFATSGAITFAPTGGTITMSGGAGAINNASGTLTFQNLTVSGSSVTSTGNFSVVVTMNVTGEFNPNAASIISGAGTLTGNGRVYVTRTAATPTFGAQYTITNKTLTDLTVDFSGAGAQTVDAQNYGNLVISTNGTRTVTLVSGGTIRVSGVFTSTTVTTTYDVTGNTFEYNGSGAQTIRAFTYNNLIISNAGIKTVLAGTTVNCQTIEINDSAVLTLPDTSVLNVQG